MNSKKISDIDSFEEIVDLYQDRLFRFAFMRVGGREVAEDIVQEVFLRLYRAMSAGKEVRSYEGFLIHSISNACIDHMRRKKPPTLQIEDIGDLPDIQDRDIDEEFRRVSLFLDGLPFRTGRDITAQMLRWIDFLPNSRTSRHSGSHCKVTIPICNTIYPKETKPMTNQSPKKNHI